MSEATHGTRQEAFDRYVVPQLPVVYRVALSLTGQPADAEDLVQDTLLRAFRGIGGFDGAHPRAWLFTILRNTHVNRNRARRPVLLRSAESAGAMLDHRGPSAPASEDVVLDQQFEAVVADALALLPAKHLSVITLVDLRGLSYQQAADSLGVPRGTVMSRLHRARAGVRAQLDAAGVVPRRRRT